MTAGTPSGTFPGNGRAMRIQLDDLRFHSYHGVMPQERRVGNEFRVDISVVIPVTGAMQRDELSGTLSYADIFDVVRCGMEQPSDLLEHVALRIAGDVSRRWKILSGEITIRKMAPPIPGMTGTAAVTLRF